jgi:hypothetical protein
MSHESPSQLPLRYAYSLSGISEHHLRQGLPIN